MKALSITGPGQKAWETVPDPGDSGADGRDRPHRLLHDLRNRPTHPQGRRARGEAGDDPRPRGGRNDHRAQARRSRRSPSATASLVSCISVVRPLQLLPRGPLRPVHRRRRLDLRPPDRRPAGRVRARPVRGYLRLQDPGGADGRAGALPRGHPSDRVRSRSPERPGGAGRHDRRRRRRPDRPRHDHDRASADAGEDHRRSIWPTRGSPARSTSVRTW